MFKGALQIMILKVTDTEEEEFDKELNSAKPVKGSTILEPEVEPEKETVKLSVEPKPTTPMPTSASTSKKSELSIMMDTDYVSEDGAEEDKGNESEK
ncbi:hypothetical protein PVK06_039997 [Gossypium arboreum]|uniref:Uncharacterized protein n=1 Tax=Gossypium arboreum TaxID=29729 RepID=A0ABR0N724_GOSAR|nr:hypothetical protein PVK06_039997 [Gossypium arboreum]